MRVPEIVRYLLVAIATAAYWFVAAWCCFALFSRDPIDLLFGEAAPARTVSTVLVLAVFVGLFAIWDHWRVGRSARHHG